MELHSRAKIRLETNSDVVAFVSTMNSIGGIDKYIIENFDCSLSVDAHSYLGVLYASAEFGRGGLFLVNKTNDGHIPAVFDKYYI